MDHSPLRAVRPRLEHLRHRLVRPFSVDTRSLAAFRVALGAIVLADLAWRVGDLGLYYTAEGVYPIAVHEAAYGAFGRYSLFALSDALWVQGLLFAATGVFALGFCLGYRTRLTGLASLVLVLSLQVRNPTVLNGGDRLLWLLLCIGLLTPLGERWSLDARRRTAPARGTVATLGTAALLVQPLAVFTSNAVRKARGEYWLSGDGLALALHNDAMTRSFADALLAAPPLVVALNYLWLAALFGSVPLLLGTSGRLRAAAVSAYVAAFAGMFATMTVGLFPFALAASVLGFVPGVAWEALERRAPPRLARLADPIRGSASSASAALPATPASVGTIGERPRSVPPFDPAGIRRTLFRTVSAVVLVWMVAFSALSAAGAAPPPPLDADALDQQDWGLYAPDPQPVSTWYVIEAELADGARIDALDGGPVGFDRPPDGAGPDGARHRSFMQTVSASGAGAVDPAVAERYGQWVCERAGVHAADVERVAVRRIDQPTTGDGPDGRPTESVVAESECR